MAVAQMKTLERLIIRQLHRDQAITAAYVRMRQHFSDEEYLYKIAHTEIIMEIYENFFYDRCPVSALCQNFHLDVKTLLNYRKSYLRLFAKFYLELSKPAKTEFDLLCERLTQMDEPTKRRKRKKPQPHRVASPPTAKKSG